jgi:hypothetical protein
MRKGGDEMAVIGHVTVDWIDGEGGFEAWSKRHIDETSVAGVRHWPAAADGSKPGCPHTDRNRTWIGHDSGLSEPLPDCDERCSLVYRVVLFRGKVLTEFECNYHDDSDFYAVVWTGESLKRFMYGTTRCASTGWSARVDATEETKAEARVWLERAAYEDAVALAEEEARKVKVGRRVRSWKGRGRKVIEGTVFWAGLYRPRGTYSDWAAVERVGIETDDGERVFTPLSRAEVIDPEPVDLDACRRSAKAIAEAGRWRREGRGWYG